MDARNIFRVKQRLLKTKYRNWGALSAGISIIISVLSWLYSQAPFVATLFNIDFEGHVQPGDSAIPFAVSILFLFIFSLMGFYIFFGYLLGFFFKIPKSEINEVFF